MTLKGDYEKTYHPPGPNVSCIHTALWHRSKTRKKLQKQSPLWDNQIWHAIKTVTTQGMRLNKEENKA